MKEKRYIYLESFVTDEEAQAIVGEVLAQHRLNSLGTDLSIDAHRTNSLKLELGISCGEDLRTILELSSTICRRAFEHASIRWSDVGPIKVLCDPATPLTGLSLLYGPSAVMAPHYDSPTQPGQKEEWLCMFTMGLPCLFRLDDEVIEIKSGDALVMDSMSVLHGVEKVLTNVAEDQCSALGLPSQCRLGVLFWHGKNTTLAEDDDFQQIDGLAAMYGEPMDEMELPE